MARPPLLATPISHLFEDAGTGQAIAAAGDCLEVRDQSLDSELPNQLLYHGDLDIIKPWTGSQKRYLEDVLTRKQLLLLMSFHMASCYTEPELRDYLFHPGGVILTRNELLHAAAHNIEWLRKAVGSCQIEIAVENNNYYPTGAYEHVTDADFIAEVVRGNSVQFLFDTAHAHITAHNRRLPYKRYVDGLPLDRAIQIHVTRHGVDDDDQAFDAHELPDKSVLQEAQRLIDDYDIEYVTFEYYRDAQELVKLLRRFKEQLQIAVK